MTQVIKSNILWTLVLPNHASGGLSHDNLYKTSFYPSECIRPMNIFWCIYGWLGKTCFRSNKNFMTLVGVANIRLIDKAYRLIITDN